MTKLLSPSMHFFFILLLFNSSTLLAQDFLDVKKEFPALYKNSNSIVVDHHITIEIDAYNKMDIIEEKELIILNKRGLKDIDAYEFYDKYTKVKSINVQLFDSHGKEIESFKKKDFKDVSAVPNGTLYTENRVLFLDISATQFPLKVKYKSQVKSKNTAFLRRFTPVTNYNQSVKSYQFKIINNSGEELRFHKNDLAHQLVKEDLEENDYTFTVENLVAVVREPYSLSLKNLSPQIKFALTKFQLEGVTGEARNWDEFGQWKNNNLLDGVTKLPPKTIKEIQQLVAPFETDIDKAKAIYNYVQDNTRYISLQIGIGGWRPTDAEEVDYFKYGDCKGLTNYTRALLSAVGIPSNYCVVYASKEITDIEEDFTAMQGNHVILNIPFEDQDVWLECTSQKVPFNYLGTSTDNRKVFAVNESGGKIKKTPSFPTASNHQATKAKIKLVDNNLEANLSIQSKGTKYGERFYLFFEDSKSVNNYYQKQWSYLQRLKLEDYHFTNNKEDIEFTEELQVKIGNYFKRYGNDLIFEVNPFNKAKFKPSNSSERKNPFTIQRGFVEEDEYAFDLNSFNAQALPEDIILETKFGTYQLTFESKEGQLIVRRFLKIHAKNYEQSDFVAFEDFINKIEKHDNTKVVFN